MLVWSFCWFPRCANLSIVSFIPDVHIILLFRRCNLRVFSHLLELLFTRLLGLLCEGSLHRSFLGLLLLLRVIWSQMLFQNLYIIALMVSYFLLFGFLLLLSFIYDLWCWIHSFSRLVLVSVLYQAYSVVCWWWLYWIINIGLLSGLWVCSFFCAIFVAK